MGRLSFWQVIGAGWRGAFAVLAQNGALLLAVTLPGSVAVGYLLLKAKRRR